MEVPCEVNICGYRENYRGTLQRDCRLIAGMISRMSEFDYQTGECPYATMAAMNVAGGLSNPTIVEAEELSDYAERYNLGSGEQPEDLLD